MSAAVPAPNSSSAAILFRALPAVAVGVLLAVPSLGLGFFWDDFALLSRVQSSPINALGPAPGSPFYRPISQGVYFWLLAALGGSGPTLANILNLALFAISVCLVVLIAEGLGGPRAGLVAGLVFAGLAPISSLICWASGAQDLLAILFTLAAVHLRASGRHVGAAIFAVVGLLSKETAILVIPVLILWDWIAGTRPARIGVSALRYGGLALAWAALHPGIRQLALQGLSGEPHGAVGFRNFALTEHQARLYLLTLFNLPITGARTPWPEGRMLSDVAAVSIAIASFWMWPLRGGRRPPSMRDLHAPSVHRSLRRVTLLATLLAIPGILLPSLLITRWAAYFVCLPAIGSSLFIGVLLARAPLALVSLSMAGYIGLGIWCRGIEVPGGSILTERTFVEASYAIRDVKKGFLELHPTLPRGSQVLVSVAASGALGIYQSIHDGQALRIWYGDPTIRTLRPERRSARPPSEFLFRITSSRGVVEIDPDRATFRSGGGNPQVEEVRSTIRTYARGVAASGEGARSVGILERLSERDEDPLRSYDLRLAAMAIMAEGDSLGAMHLLSRAPPITRDFALYAVAKVMADPTGSTALDSCAFPAFEVSPSDPAALRFLMETFYGSAFVTQAIHSARRLQTVAPGDSESVAILRALGADP